MGLVDTIGADMQDAMRAGDALRRDTLRMVIAAFKNKAVEPGRASRELAEDEALAVLLGAVKSRKDSAQQYDDAGRAELAAKERAEIAVIEGYLPQQLSEADTRAAVERAIAEVGATSKLDMGKVIKVVMGAHKGQVDGKAVQQLVSQMLQ
jgi:hypothetical protein